VKLSYSTDAKIRLAWDNSSETELTEAFLTDIKTYIDGIIDAFLNNRYTLPLSSTPGIIEGISTDLCVIEAKRRKNPGILNENDRITESSHYAMLEAIKDHKISLPSISENQLVESNTKDYSPIFGVDDELNQEVDEDRLDDIADDRE
jgi:phage gp36-like protein